MTRLKLRKRKLTGRRITSGSLRLVLDSKIQYIDFVHSMTEKLGRMSGLSQDCSFRTGLAVREALINAILHGNREDPDKKVTIDFIMESGIFSTRVQDQGEGFDFDTAPDPLNPENLYSTNGRGIFLMRHFAEEVNFRRTPDGGTEVEILQRAGRARTRKQSSKSARGTQVTPGWSAGGEGMKAAVRKIANVSVLDLAGKITIGAGDLIFREAINALLEEENRFIVINLEKVSYMDSAGIGELVACRKRAEDLQGGVKLLKPSGKVSDLLHLTKLEEIFEIFQDEDRAVASFT